MKPVAIGLGLYFAAIMAFTMVDAQQQCDPSGNNCRPTTDYVVIDETNTPLSEIETVESPAEEANPDVDDMDLTSDSDTAVNKSAPVTKYSQTLQTDDGTIWTRQSDGSYIRSSSFRNQNNGSNGSRFGSWNTSDAFIVRNYGSRVNSYGSANDVVVSYGYSRPSSVQTYTTYSGGSGSNGYGWTRNTYSSTNAAPRLNAARSRRRWGFGFGVFKPFGFFRRN